MLPEPITVTLLVVDALDRLGVVYAIGGSLASAIHGVMRSTLDADLVADLRPEHAQPLADALAAAFYADSAMMTEAINHRGSFNVIHLETMFKVDIFAARPRAFDQAQLQRRQVQRISTDPEREAYVVSAEDIVLAKLEWYRAAGEVSDRQWRDVLGVLQVQAHRLNLAYMRSQALALGCADLLQRALTETDLAQDEH